MKARTWDPDKSNDLHDACLEILDLIRAGEINPRNFNPHVLAERGGHLRSLVNVAFYHNKQTPPRWVAKHLPNGWQDFLRLLKEVDGNGSVFEGTKRSHNMPTIYELHEMRTMQERYETGEITREEAVSSLIDDGVELTDGQIRKWFRSRSYAPRAEHEHEEPTNPEIGRKKMLLEDIIRLDKQIRSIQSDSCIEKQRQFQMGNLFEEIVLLDLQLRTKYQVPQYCLSAKRDRYGNIVDTKNIIDFIVLNSTAEGTFEKAMAEWGVKQGLLEKLGEGEIVSRKKKKGDLEYTERRYVSNGKTVYTEVNKNVRLFEADDEMGFSSYWVSYKDVKTGKTFFVEQAVSDRASLIDGEKPTEELDRWRAITPLSGIEVKKAGSQDPEVVAKILEQLEKQKKAILSRREEEPLNLQAMVGGIEVLVLNENTALKRALKDDPFFRYTPCSLAQKDTEGILEMLKSEAYTLDELRDLREFFSKINYELAKHPTLPTLESMYKEFIEEKTESQAKQKKRDLRVPEIHISEEDVENAKKNPGPKVDRSKYSPTMKLLDRFMKKCEMEDKRKEVEGKIKALIDDFYRTMGPKVERDTLKKLFEQHIGSSYEIRGSLNSSTIVNEEYRGRVIHYPRKIFLESSARRPLIERAQEVVGKRLYQKLAVNLEDEESISKFIELQKQMLEERKRNKEVKDHKEKEFCIDLLNCRFANYEESSELELEHLVDCSFNLDSGLLSRLSSVMTGKEIDPLQAVEERYLISELMQRVVEDDKSPLGHRVAYVHQKQMDRKSLLEESVELESELYSLFEEVAKGRGSFEQANLIGWRNRINELGEKYSQVLGSENPYNSGIESLAAVHRRAHTRNGFISKFANGCKEEDLAWLTGIASQCFGDEIGELTIPQMLDGKFAERMKEAEKKLAKEDQNRLERLRAEFRKELAKDSDSMEESMKDAMAPYIYFSEQRIIYGVGKRTLENALAMSTIGIGLARDYVESNLMTLATYPHNYRDIYVRAVKEVVDKVKAEENIDMIDSYLSQTEEEHKERNGEFVRRWALMHITNREEADEFLDAIKEGDYDGALEIELKHSKPTVETLQKIYEKEVKDPHMKNLRRSQRIKSSGIKERLADYSENLKADNRKIMQQMGEIMGVGSEIDLLEEIVENKEPIAKRIKPENEKEFKKQILNLLNAYRGLPESRQKNYVNMMRAETYHGFKGAGQAANAIDYLNGLMTFKEIRKGWVYSGEKQVGKNRLKEIAADLLFNPEDILVYCGYITQAQADMFKPTEIRNRNGRNHIKKTHQEAQAPAQQYQEPQKVAAQAQIEAQAPVESPVRERSLLDEVTEKVERAYRRESNNGYATRFVLHQKHNRKQMAYLVGYNSGGVITDVYKLNGNPNAREALAKWIVEGMIDVDHGDSFFHKKAGFREARGRGLEL